MTVYRAIQRQASKANICHLKKSATSENREESNALGRFFSFFFSNLKKIQKKNRNIFPVSFSNLKPVFNLVFKPVFNPASFAKTKENSTEKEAETDSKVCSEDFSFFFSNLEKVSFYKGFPAMSAPGNKGKRRKNQRKLP